MYVQSSYLYIQSIDDGDGMKKAKEHRISGKDLYKENETENRKHLIAS